MGMLHNWFKQLQQYFSENDTKKEQPEQELRKSYRIHQSDHSEDKSKMIYHYPKEGKFRFPVDVDRPSDKRNVHLDKPTTKPESQPMKTIEKKVKPEPFSNQHYKWSTTPSPIYGFGQQKQPSVSPPLKHSEGEEKPNTHLAIYEEDILNQPVQESESTYIKDEFPMGITSTAKDMNVESVDTNIRNIADHLLEQEQEQEQEKEKDQIIEVSVGEKDLCQPFEKPNEQEQESLAKIELEHVEIEPVSELADTESGQSLATEKNEEAAKEMVVESDEEKSVSEQDNKKEYVRTEQKKPTIPFNVMMLPQDRGKKNPGSATPQSDYSYPTINLLHYPNIKQDDETEWLESQSTMLEETLENFHVEAKVVNVTKGPSVTRLEIQPGRGVKVTKITGLIDDIKLALSAKDIRIEAPIPGKNTIGIEVPNRHSAPVFLREILRRDVFVRSSSPLTVALGLDISGQPIVTDLQKMPHGLVAGATGSGKSVCINSILISLLFKANPDEVKIMLIDPKMVELAPYNGLPHLITPVITDSKQATAALKWVVQEMERRYELFRQYGVRDVKRYNDLYSESIEKPALPYMLVVIDELADLMMVSPQEVEDSICRIAQKARACGIHLLLATQRPSVDVITGLIKANIPTRIAFSVSSQTDSRTILDVGGAERLLGRGDMLFQENGTPKAVRVQGTFVSDEEIDEVVAYVKKQREPQYLLESEQLVKVASQETVEEDDLFEEACHFVIEQGGASASLLQRKFRVGYNRAARLIDMMEDYGIVSEAMGSKPRHILVDSIKLEEILYHESEV